jgi:hypothetical protein
LVAKKKKRNDPTSSSSSSFDSFTILNKICGATCAQEALADRIVTGHKCGRTRKDFNKRVHAFSSSFRTTIQYWALLRNLETSIHETFWWVFWAIGNFV